MVVDPKSSFTFSFKNGEPHLIQHMEEPMIYLWKEHGFIFHTLYLSDCLPHLGVITWVSRLLDTLIYTLRRVTLLVQQRFVLFDDLSDPRKVGVDLWLGRVRPLLKYPGED